MDNSPQSPFPGVDPYLEKFWGDIHTRLMVYLSDQIDEQLPGDLQARVEESVSVDQEETSRWVYPDVKVVEASDSAHQSGTTTTTATAVANPCVIPLPDEKVTERRIEIVDLNSGNRVVTAIELLGPGKKNEEAGRQAYRRKQLAYIQGCVNLVEVDLIRAGQHMVAAPEGRIPEEHRTPYLVCIRCVQRPTQAEIISIPIDEPVPNFRIPLRPHDAEPIVRLQPLLNECYRRGRYSSIDYKREPTPKLEGDHGEWADKLLKSHGLR